MLRAPRRTGATAILAAANAAALIPAGLTHWMLRSGMSPTVQFNAGSDEAMAMWSTYIHLWPSLMLGLLACLIVAVGAALCFLATRFGWSEIRRSKATLAYIALTLAHLLLALSRVGEHFPTT